MVDHFNSFNEHKLYPSRNASESEARVAQAIRARQTSPKRAANGLPFVSGLPSGQVPYGAPKHVAPGAFDAFLDRKILEVNRAALARKYRSRATDRTKAIGRRIVGEGNDRD